MRCVSSFILYASFPNNRPSFWPKKGIWDPERVITVAAELFRLVKQDSYLFCGLSLKTVIPTVPIAKALPLWSSWPESKVRGKEQAQCWGPENRHLEVTPNLKFRISEGRASPFHSRAPYLLLPDLRSTLLPGDLEIILVPLVSLPACVLGIIAFRVYGQNTGSWLNVQRGMTACNKTQQVSTLSPPPNISRGLSNPFATPTAIECVLLFLNFVLLVILL